MQIESRSPFAAMLDWFRRGRGDDLALIDPAEMRHIADDLRISVADLRQAAAQSEDEAALMRRMLALHGLDLATIERELPLVARDMAISCARCESKGQCAHELDHGTSVEAADRFCPNADTMQALARA